MSHNLMGSLNTGADGLTSSLRPPSSRSALASNHHLRASADMSGTSSSSTVTDSRMRPSSEIYSNQYRQSQLSGDAASMDKAAQQWIDDIDQSERMLEEMAAATLDPVLKDELTAIEQWFRILAEPERTAVLYALLQQTTQIQVRFLIGVLQQMAKKHPTSGLLSPSSYGERDAMSNRLSTALSRLGVDDHPPSSFPVGSGRTPASPSVTTKSAAGLHMDEINSMFPDAAASIAKQKADFTEQTGTAPPPSNRNSTATVDRSSLVAPSISAPNDDQRKDSFGRPPPSPWGPSSSMQHGRPKSSSSNQQPMGQFSQPPPSAGLRSPRPPTDNTRILDHNGLPPMPILSPYPAGSWASMVNTPMTGTFQSQHRGGQSGDGAAMIADATAAKLHALSTHNNRIELDDVRKYRRSRSTEGQRSGQPGQHQSIPANFVMTNERGEILTPQQAAALQAQQLAALSGRRSRPSSPSLQIPGSSGTGMGGGFGFGAPQNNGFLAPDGGMGAMGGYLGVQHGDTGYLSDGLDIPRGRSPRGRRGSSKPPEDPTDIELLKDIPAWLRSLRLHKYTDSLKDLHWQDLIMLDEAGLEKRGVNALGARRKMLKVFEQVKEAQASGKA